MKDYLYLHLRDLPYFRGMLRALEAQFYQDFELPSPTLDVGCGDGHFATIAFDRPLDVGLDPWGGPIRQAARLGGYRSLVQADGGHGAFPGWLLCQRPEQLGAGAHPACSGSAGRDRPLAAARGAFPVLRAQPALPERAVHRRYFEPPWAERPGSRLHRWFRRMSRVEHAVEPEVWQGWLEAAGFHLERWWHYFSPEAMRALEWGHYFGAPTLLPHTLFKRWILVPARWNLALTERFVRRYAVAEPHPQGTFTFYVARRV